MSKKQPKRRAQEYYTFDEYNRLIGDLSMEDNVIGGDITDVLGAVDRQGFSRRKIMAPNLQLSLPVDPEEELQERRVGKKYYKHGTKDEPKKLVEGSFPKKRLIHTGVYKPSDKPSHDPLIELRPPLVMPPIRSLPIPRFLSGGRFSKREYLAPVRPKTLYPSPPRVPKVTASQSNQQDVVEAVKTSIPTKEFTGEVVKKEVELDSPPMAKADEEVELDSPPMTKADEEVVDLPKAVGRLIDELDYPEEMYPAASVEIPVVKKEFNYKPPPSREAPNRPSKFREYQNKKKKTTTYQKKLPNLLAKTVDPKEIIPKASSDVYDVMKKVEETITAKDSLDAIGGIENDEGYLEEEYEAPEGFGEEYEPPDSIIITSPSPNTDMDAKSMGATQSREELEELKYQEEAANAAFANKMREKNRLISGETIVIDVDPTTKKQFAAQPGETTEDYLSRMSKKTHVWDAPASYNFPLVPDSSLTVNRPGDASLVDGALTAKKTMLAIEGVKVGPEGDNLGGEKEARSAEQIAQNVADIVMNNDKNTGEQLSAFQAQHTIPTLANGAGPSRLNVDTATPAQLSAAIDNLHKVQGGQKENPPANYALLKDKFGSGVAPRSRSPKSVFGPDRPARNENPRRRGFDDLILYDSTKQSEIEARWAKRHGRKKRSESPVSKAPRDTKMTEILPKVGVDAMKNAELNSAGVNPPPKGDLSRALITTAPDSAKSMVPTSAPPPGLVNLPRTTMPAPGMMMMQGGGLLSLLPPKQTDNTLKNMPLVTAPQRQTFTPGMMDAIAAAAAAGRKTLKAGGKSTAAGGRRPSDDKKSIKAPPSSLAVPSERTFQIGAQNSILPSTSSIVPAPDLGVGDIIMGAEPKAPKPGIPAARSGVVIPADIDMSAPQASLPIPPAQQSRVLQAVEATQEIREIRNRSRKGPPRQINIAPPQSAGAAPVITINTSMPPMFMGGGGGGGMGPVNINPNISVKPKISSRSKTRAQSKSKSKAKNKRRTKKRVSKKKTKKSKKTYRKKGGAKKTSK